MYNIAKSNDVRFRRVVYSTKKSTLILVMQDYENSTVACWERTMSEHNFHYMKGSFEGNSFNGEA